MIMYLFYCGKKKERKENMGLWKIKTFKKWKKIVINKEIEPYNK